MKNGQKLEVLVGNVQFSYIPYRSTSYASTAVGSRHTRIALYMRATLQDRVCRKTCMTFYQP